VFPDYKPLRKAEDSSIYYVKNTVSDLKDEDFIQAAQEYKTQKEQELTIRQAKQTEEREREREYLKTSLALT
jgi:hypothetical protein